MNLAESITKKIEADASRRSPSYSVTVLHLGSEKTDGIDHSWARPLAREVIALLVQLLATAQATADGTALVVVCNATIPPVEDTLLREVDLRQLAEKAPLSVELVTMCLESASELQAGTSGSIHTK